MLPGIIFPLPILLQENWDCRCVPPSALDGQTPTLGQHVVCPPSHLPSPLVCFLGTPASQDVEAELRVTYFITSWYHLNGGHEGITRIYLTKFGMKTTIECPVHMAQFHRPGHRNSENSLPKQRKNSEAVSTVVDLPLYLLHFYLCGTHGVYAVAGARLALSDIPFTCSKIKSSRYIWSVAHSSSFSCTVILILLGVGHLLEHAWSTP